MKAASPIIAIWLGLTLTGCQSLLQRAASPADAASDAAGARSDVSVCPGLPAFAATVASYSAVELQTATEGLRNTESRAPSVCDQARLALLQARPGHGGFDPAAAETRFAALLDGDAAMDRWTRRFLISSRDTLAAWMEAHRALKQRLLVLEQTVDTRERTIRNMQDQIDALTSIERAPDRGFD